MSQSVNSFEKPLAILAGDFLFTRKIGNIKNIKSFSTFPYHIK